MTLLPGGLRQFGASVRAKLLFMVLAPLLFGGPIVLGLVWYLGNEGYRQLLTYKINSDLVIAHEYFANVIDGLGGRIELMAAAEPLHRALASQDRVAVEDVLNQSRRRFRFDFMYVLDRDGKVRYSSAASHDDESHRRWPVVARALDGYAGSRIDIYTVADLEAVDPSLADRAAINIVPTTRAAPDSRSSETRGMLIHAAAPIFDAAGRLTGAVEGGMLLNGNLEFVDTINAIVYREGSLPLGSKGTATLFLDDTRIATNVRLFEGERALGTRVSQSVRVHVLRAGKVWLDTAFVVNDWYVSGYEPVIDSFGNHVGMLYVGFLETPFHNARTAAMGAVLALFAGIGVLGAAWSLRRAREIFRPIERMDATISSIDAGAESARVGDTGSRDELGRLAVKFDSLLDSLAEKRHELERWGSELDHKVAERTLQLEVAHDELIAAQRQLVTSEKLAAIGELTAGVAHEINNPVAVIQGNLDVLRDVLGPQATGVANEIRLIDEQVNRIRIIVTRLLQFARPGDFAGYVQSIDPATLIADCLVLTQHHLTRNRIEVVTQLDTRRTVRINQQELQQVMINLIVNAVHAMPEGGTLTLRAEDWDDAPGGNAESESGPRARGIRLRVRDSGEGIRPENLGRIFDPFFTTKKREGTGLGLSISYSLIKRYGGRISVESVHGEGAEFTVWILAEPEYSAENTVPSPTRLALGSAPP